MSTWGNIYKGGYIGSLHVSFMPHQRARGSPPWWWSLPWSAATMRPPAWERPSVHSPLTSRVLYPNWNKAPQCWPFPPAQDVKVCCRYYCEVKVSPRPTCEGELCSRISVISGMHPQHQEWSVLVLSPITVSMDRQDFTTCVPTVDSPCDPAQYAPGPLTVTPEGLPVPRRALEPATQEVATFNAWRDWTWPQMPTCT
jgi:hypothetical protein